MRGVGHARAAISIVNALPLGVGAAVGIEWPTKATAYLEPGPRVARGPAVEPRSSATPLVRAAARLALERFAPPSPGRLRIVVRSTIPVARGLKSSSAVSASVALATARAGGKEPDPAEVARVAADAGRESGTSATGAFDDALASLIAGGVVTDNAHDAVLRHLSLEPDLGVVLWVPDRPHPRSPSVLRRFRRYPDLAHRAVDAALAGDWAGAMEANSALVESAMGYRYARLHEVSAREGAVAAGVSGIGPAFAAVAPAPRLGRIARALPPGAQRRSVRLFRDERTSRREAR